MSSSWSYVSFERHFHFWPNYLVPASLVNCKSLECLFSLNFCMFCMVFEKGIKKFFAVIICLIIANREKEWGEKYRSWIILKGTRLHLKVLKRLIKIMKLSWVFNWEAQKWNALLPSLKVWNEKVSDHAT